jgi:bifunctional non-homologous end joining protein LigD
MIEYSERAILSTALRRGVDDISKECRWLKPELVAQIEFTEWTPDGHLRHSSFVGLRDDKEARKVRRE